MKAWKNLLVRSNQPIMDAIKVLNDHCQFAVVINETGILQGTITDGDLRRGILKGVDLNRNLVTDIMNSSPITARDRATMSEIYAELNKIESNVSLIPLIDEKRVVTGIFSLGEQPEESNSNIPRSEEHTSELQSH